MSPEQIKARVRAAVEAYMWVKPSGIQPWTDTRAHLQVALAAADEAVPVVPLEDLRARVIVTGESATWCDLCHEAWDEGGIERHDPKCLLTRYPQKNGWHVQPFDGEVGRGFRWSVFYGPHTQAGFRKTEREAEYAARAALNNLRCSNRPVSTHKTTD